MNITAGLGKSTGEVWLEQGWPNRENAADFVGRFYYNQDPKLLRWALTNPMERVVYTPLSPRKPDFDMVRDRKSSSASTINFEHRALCIQKGDELNHGVQRDSRRPLPIPFTRIAGQKLGATDVDGVYGHGPADRHCD